MTIPRSVLLPNFLNDAAWTDLTDAIDSVFKGRVDDPTTWLYRIRDHFLTNPITDQKVLDSVLISENDFDIFDRETQVQSLGLSGFQLPKSDNFTQAQYQRIQREISTYWYSKGNYQLTDFISSVLGFSVEMENMWTQDYVSFFPESSAEVGIPIYAGGTWYPTTHLLLSVDRDHLSIVPLSAIISFFYSISNYTMVIGAIAHQSYLPIANVDDPVYTFPGYPGSPAYVLGLYFETQVFIPLVN